MCMCVYIFIGMYVFFNQVQNDCTSNAGGCLVQCGSLGRITIARPATMYWTSTIISALPGVLLLKEKQFFSFPLLLRKRVHALKKTKKTTTKTHQKTHKPPPPRKTKNKQKPPTQQKQTTSTEQNQPNKKTKPKCVYFCNMYKTSFPYQGLNSAFCFLCSQISTLILKTEMHLSLALQDTLSKLQSILAW